MRRIFALLSLALLGACSQEIDQSTRPDNIVGTYHLVTYGGTSLPATLRSDSVNVQILDGTLIVASDGQWSETVSLQAKAGGSSQVESFTSFGNWTIVREFAYMTFYDKTNSYQFTGTASGATIVLDNVSGEQLIYRR